MKRETLVRIRIGWQEFGYRVVEELGEVAALPAEAASPDLTLDLEVPLEAYRPHPGDPEALKRLVAGSLESLGPEWADGEKLRAKVEEELLWERGRIPRDVLVVWEGRWRAYALDWKGRSGFPSPHRSEHAESFAIGYGGSGPHALGESVLRYFTGRPWRYGAFTWEIVARLDPSVPEHRIPAEVVARYLPGVGG